MTVTGVGGCKMAVAIRNATVTVQVLEEPVGDDLQVKVPRVVQEHTGIKVYLEPLSADAAYRETGIELHRPHRLMADLEDAGKFTVGNRVLWGDRKFAVMKPALRYETKNGADHFSVVLEELDLM